MGEVVQLHPFDVFASPSRKNSTDIQFRCAHELVRDWVAEHCIPPAEPRWEGDTLVVFPIVRAAHVARLIDEGGWKINYCPPS